MVLEKMESPEYLYAIVNIYNELLLIPKNELDGLETKYIRYDKAEKELLDMDADYTIKLHKANELIAELVEGIGYVLDCIDNSDENIMYKGLVKLIANAKEFTG